MGRLHQRQELLRKQASDRRKIEMENPRLVVVTPPWLRIGKSDYSSQPRRPIPSSVEPRWRGCPTVLAFLFAFPDSDAIRVLDARAGYFDLRTNDTWDLFFPGYYRSKTGQDSERDADAKPVGKNYISDWYFNPSDFNTLREYIERSSERRWEYSGGTDLVLIGGWLPDRGEPTIDWASTICGQVTDQTAGTKTLTLATIIERITRDLETEAENDYYGVGEVANPSNEQSSPRNHITRDFMINALAGIAAALGARALGA